MNDLHITPRFDLSANFTIKPSETKRGRDTAHTDFTNVFCDLAAICPTSTSTTPSTVCAISAASMQAASCIVRNGKNETANAARSTAAPRSATRRWNRMTTGIMDRPDPQAHSRNATVAILSTVTVPARRDCTPHISPFGTDAVCVLGAMGVDLEICVDSLASSHAAVAGGATRLELCSALAQVGRSVGANVSCAPTGVRVRQGGLTPSIGMVRRVVALGAPVHVLIRPRPCDFVFTEEGTSAARTQC